MVKVKENFRFILMEDIVFVEVYENVYENKLTKIFVDFDSHIT